MLEFLKNLWETLKQLGYARPVFLVWAIIMTVLYFGGPNIGEPFDLSDPIDVDRLAHSHPELAQAARQAVPQDSAGGMVLFIVDEDLLSPDGD